MRRRAFTLVELLVVIAIVLVLVGLVVGVAGIVRRAAKDVLAANRVEGVGVALSQALAGSEDAGYRLLRDGLGKDLRFTTLRVVLDDLRDPAKWSGNFRTYWRGRGPWTDSNYWSGAPPYLGWKPIRVRTADAETLFFWTYHSVGSDNAIIRSRLGERVDFTMEVMLTPELRPNPLD